LAGGLVGVSGSAGRVAADPPPNRTRVYVVNGLDPFGWAGAERLADRIRASGYPDTHFISGFRARRIEREVRAAYAADPSTPVILIGYSMGSYSARRVAGRLGQDGIPVAMVGYVGGDFMPGSSAAWPTNVGQVVNVTGNGYLLTGRNLIANGADIPGAANLRLPVRHFDLPGRPETVELLLREMGTAASGGQ
jgi:pimeloyl-ACP methyl ester carboxylesterase